MQAILWVFIGGGMGSVCRYLISLWVPFTGTSFPWATFLANFLACITIGSLTQYVIGQGENDWIKWLFITGFCGGFSTFSTFSLEILTLLRSQQWGLAALYVLISTLICLLGVWMGIRLIKAIL